MFCVQFFLHLSGIYYFAIANLKSILDISEAQLSHMENADRFIFVVSHLNNQQQLSSVLYL